MFCLCILQVFLMLGLRGFAELGSLVLRQRQMQAPGYTRGRGEKQDAIQSDLRPEGKLGGQQWTDPTTTKLYRQQKYKQVFTYKITTLRNNKINKVEP